MTTTEQARRSFWAWGSEAQEPSDADRAERAKELSQRYGVTVDPPKIPLVSELDLRAPRIAIPEALAEFCSSDDYERASHTYGRSYLERARAIQRDFAHPPDVVARPRNEGEVEQALDWCHTNGYVAIPFGGGSSVVDGVSVPESADAAVTIDLAALDRVLEIDETSRAARIQAGVLGPELENQLRPHGYTLRHFPQSFEWSTLGGWIATRSGGHYATNQTHIDDFVESTRMITPNGWWESRRLPGSGAGPSPDRLVIGSEGILGIITEAWMQIQLRPTFRASAGVTFDSWEAAGDACRRITQAKLWPANCRVLDAEQAKNDAELDGKTSLLIIGFESGEVAQGENIRSAVALARDAGGIIDDEEIVVVDGSGKVTGREGAVGAWRNAFVTGPYEGNLTVGLGLVGDTFETAITWDRWPEFDANVREAVGKVIDETCGHGSLACRFTHVYPDGPAPYYTFSGLGSQGAEAEQWQTIKNAASDAVITNGGTITHHHAVGRLHRYGYDEQRPELFAQALRAAKKAVDPNGILNPGVLIDP